jgi:HEAT repeat protein
MFVLLLALTCAIAKPEGSSVTHPLTKADIPADLSPELKGLIEGLLSDDGSECDTAIRSLRRIPKRAAPAVPFLIEVWLKNSGNDFHYDSYAALCEIGGPAVEPCIAALKRASSEKRIELIHELGQFNNPRMLDAVTALLDDPDPKVRRAVLFALEPNPRTVPNIVPRLIRAIKDQDAEVRERAMWYVAPDPRALEPLLDALNDKNLQVRDTAARVLSSYTDARARQALIGVFRNSKEESQVRCTAAFWLRESHSPQMFESSLAVLQNRGEAAQVRAMAAQILAALGDARATELLTQVAKEEGARPLRFWAGIGAACLTDGVIDDVRIVEAIQNYSYRADGVELYEGQKRKALSSVAERGATWAVRSAAREAMTAKTTDPVSQHQLLLLSLILMSLVLLFIIHSRSKRTSGPPTTDQPSE